MHQQLLPSSAPLARGTACRTLLRASSSKISATPSVARAFSASAMSSNVAISQDVEKMPWPTYFRIRKSKRNWEMATTVPTSMVGLMAGLSYFGSLDGSQMVFGMDPFVVYGAASVGCMGLGWLLGPFVGSSLWRLSHRKAMASIEARDREFHHHIVKNRVDPSRQSAMNPVPDFYGEKIGSLRQYRQWLRDQGKYRRKAVWPED